MDSFDMSNIRAEHCEGNEDISLWCLFKAFHGCMWYWIVNCLPWDYHSISNVVLSTWELNICLCVSYFISNFYHAKQCKTDFPGYVFYINTKSYHTIFSWQIPLLSCTMFLVVEYCYWPMGSLKPLIRKMSIVIYYVKDFS